MSKPDYKVTRLAQKVFGQAQFATKTSVYVWGATLAELKAFSEAIDDEVCLDSNDELGIEISWKIPYE